ncbi:MAG: nitroreductase family protein, partial [Candidatus Bathyarchaeia archaeon]
MEDLLDRLWFFECMDLMEIIKGRRAVRNFLDKEIAGKDLEVILEAGIWAPSGSNIQPWEFI